ncbi:TldD/PmbA family protein [Streptomyces sp. NPDC057367]|uniref:TldD/PmbA family protein n=1 Tax=Streptomyces sp. NPDC057367 TaxID=3346108 RepID=UPI0036346BD7
MDSFEVFVESTMSLRADITNDAQRLLMQESAGAALRTFLQGERRFSCAGAGSDNELGSAAARFAEADASGATGRRASPDRLVDIISGITAVTRGFREGVRGYGADRGRGVVRIRSRRYAVSDSDGRLCREESLHVHCVASAVSEGVSGTAGHAASALSDLTEGTGFDLGRNAAEQAARLASARQPESGVRAVVFSPKPAGILVHEVIGHALEGDAALAGSALWGLRGRRFSHEHLTVFDDGRSPDAWERVLADEEGTPLVEAGLVVHGEVAGPVTDLATARRLGAPPTGHGRRGGYGQPPAPRVRHTVVRPGTDTPDAIIADTADGVLVESLDSAEATVRDGRFTLKVAEAREIRGGVLGARLTGFSVTGDLTDFGLLDGIGRDTTRYSALCGRGTNWLPISGVAPTLRLPQVMVHKAAA